MKKCYEKKFLGHWAWTRTAAVRDSDATLQLLQWAADRAAEGRTMTFEVYTDAGRRMYCATAEDRRDPE